jgi:DNA-binding NarL/FixJ family response regulator
MPAATPVAAQRRALILSESKFSGLAIRSVLSDSFPHIEEVTVRLPETDLPPLDFSVIVIVEFSTIEKVTGYLELLEAHAGGLHRVVVVLRDGDEPAMLMGFVWKVAAVVPASAPIDDVARIVGSVCDGFSILPQSLVRFLVEASPDVRPDRQPPGLTNQEWRILDLMATGESNKKIADTLGVSDGTVRVHIRSIVNKLGATNRTHAALLAAGLGRTPVPVDVVTRHSR